MIRFYAAQGMFLFLCAASATTIDVISSYGFTVDGISRAVEAAGREFALNANQTVTLFFKKGKYSLSEGTVRGVVDLSAIVPGIGGRLVLAGAGMDPSSGTTLGVDGTAVTLFSRPVTRLSIRDIHFTRNSFTTTQGTCVSANATHIVLAIDTGYPTPDAILDHASPQGRFLRRYTSSLVDPHLVVDPANNGSVWPATANQQLAWDTATHEGTSTDGQQVWAFGLMPGQPYTDMAYKAEDRVGVKSKHQNNSFFFDGGSDVSFERVRWSMHSRGVARGGVSNILVDSCVVERPPMPEGATAAPMLATPGGGPQLGQPDDPITRNVTVRNYTAVGTGDDSVALFNVDGGIVEGSSIRDSFARGILICGHPNRVEVRDCDLQRNPVFNTTKCTHMN